MSFVRVSLLTVLTATALAAQSAPLPARREPSSLLQTFTFDISAALDERWRLAVEPLVFGRFTLGLSGSRTTQVDRPTPQIYYATPITRPVDLSFAPCCPVCDCFPSPDGEQGYRASSLSLNARWYPAALARDGERQRFAVYVGEFMSYEQRRISWPQWIYPPWPQDSLGIYTPGRPALGPSSVQRLRGWEPGAEVGARVMMGQRVLIDVGGMVRVATLDDPLSRRRPGDTDARLVIAIGIGW